MKNFKSSLICEELINMEETPSQQREPHPILSWITDPAEEDADSLDEITRYALDEIRIV